MVLKIFKNVRCRLHIENSETSNNDHLLRLLLGGHCRGYFEKCDTPSYITFQPYHEQGTVFIGTSAHPNKHPWALVSQKKAFET